MLKRNIEGIVHADNNAAAHVRMEVLHSDLEVYKNGSTCESQSQDDFPRSNSIPDSLSIERSCTPPASMEASQRNRYEEENLHQNSLIHPRNGIHCSELEMSNLTAQSLHHNGLIHPRNGTHCSELEISNMTAQHAYPYYMSSGVNHVMMASAQLYQKNVHDLQNHAGTSMIAHYNHVPQGGPHATGMMSYPYYPLSMCLQPGQIPTGQSWPSFGVSSSSEAKLSKFDRREAALIKFRQKKKERCFDKKIRYVNRKQLAERRPRVRGQFVSKLNGVNMDLNGKPPSIEYDEDNEEDEDDQGARDSSLANA